MFCDVIAFVRRSRAPVGSEWASIRTTTQRVQNAYPRLRSFFRPDFVSDDTRRGGVVGSHRGSEVDDVPSLRVDVAVRDRFFATVDVERAEVPPSAADDTTVLMIRATV